MKFISNKRSNEDIYNLWTKDCILCVFSFVTKNTLIRLSVDNTVIWYSSPEFRPPCRYSGNSAGKSWAILGFSRSYLFLEF